MALSATTLFGVTAAAVVVGALLVPPLARRSGRPRFVVGLCLTALAVVLAELAVVAAVPARELSTSLLGVPLGGLAAAAVLGVHAVVQGVIGVGLWRLRAWARSQT